MWDVRACRCCLSTEDKLEKISEAYKRIYATVSGLEISAGDGFPYYFCVDCNLQIKKILAFRRKCLRAYFALKEILLVKKQVTYRHILTVDRKRTNLASPYTLCKEQNICCYSITTPDATETNNNVENPDYDLELRHAPDNSHFKYNIDIKPIPASDGTNPDTEKSDNVTMVRYTPEVTNTTFIVTDIKSSDYKEFLRLEEEKKIKNEIEESYQETTYDEPLANDSELKNIDLEDIFKGLKEDASSEDEHWPVTEKIPIKEEPIEKEVVPKLRRIYRYKGWVLRSGITLYINGVKTGVRAREIARAMRDVTVRLLPVAKQKAAFKRASNMEPFKSAPFKCEICLNTHAALQALVAHVQEHNDNMQGCDVVCPICSDRFASNRALTIHGAERHWYEYTAKDDGRKMYGLSSLIQWHRQRQQQKGRSVETLGIFRRVALTQEQMKETVGQRLLECQGRPFKCNVCQLAFNAKITRDLHEKTHIKRKKYSIQCDICGVYRRHRKSLAKHIRLCHMYALECKECGQLLYSKMKAMKHARVEHFVLKCLFCDATLMGNLKYKEHRQLMHSDETKVGQCHCPTCGYMLYSERELIVHQYRRHQYYCINDSSMGPPECRCPKCDIQFVDQSSYQHHVLIAGHRDLAKAIDLACWPCRAIFVSAEAKLAHADKCRDNYPRRCFYCPEILRDGLHSKSHHGRLHHSVETIKAKCLRLCDQCGKVVNRTTWYNHLKSHNNEELKMKNTQCQYCFARLSNPKIYISHVLLHHTLRPFLCAVCPAGYKFRTHCRDHILKVHAPERPYGCDYCSRRFAHLDYLEEHSLKAHDVSVRKAHMAKHNYLSRKQKDKIFVYPLMKIDASLVRPEMLEKVQLEICDYMDTNNRPVEDYRDYLIVDNVQEPVLNVKNDYFVQSLAQEVNETGDQQTIKRKKKMAVGVVKKKITKNNCVFEDDRNMIIGRSLLKKEIRDFKEENLIIKDENIEISIEDRSADLEGGISENRFVTREKGICGRSLPKLDEDMIYEDTKYEIKENGNVSDESVKLIDKSGNVKLDEDMIYEDTKYEIKENGNVLVESVKIIDESGNVLDVSENILDESVNALDESETMLHESGNVLDESGNMLDQSENVLDESGNVLDESGNMLDQSENVLDESGNVLDESVNMLHESGNVLDECGEMLDESGNVVKEMVDEQYDVIEHDGKQFVMIDGVLYKLEAA